MEKILGGAEILGPKIVAARTPQLKTAVEKIFQPRAQFVSPIGLGTVKFGRNTGVKYPGGDGFALPSDADIESILDLCLDLGINLLDTAPAYGASEERLGKLLGARRDKFFLMTKTGEEFDGETSQYIFTADHTRMSVERSLKRLQTDYLDYVLVHSSRDDMSVIDNTPVLETLNRLKDEGKIAKIGVSTYTVEGGKRAADLCDCVMVAFNKSYTAEMDVISHAADRGREVFIKKGLASGHTGSIGDVGDNIRFILSTRGVTSLIVGSINSANISANIKALIKG